MRNSFLLILTLAALTACTPAAAPTADRPADPNGQTIIVWHSAEGSLGRALMAQIDEFNATNEWGILVVPEYRGDEAGLMRAVQDAIDSAHTPDLVLGQPLNALGLGEAVVPVDSYVLDAEVGLSEADLADLYPAPLDANRDPTRDGELIGFPIGADGVVLVYNVDRLAAAGYLTPPGSWPLFREVCLVTTVDRNGDRQPDVYGFGFAPRPEFVSAWFLSREAPLLSPDGRSLGFEGESGYKVLETLSESAQGGCFHRAPGRDADLEAFSSGRVAMIFANATRLRDIDQTIRDRGGFRWGVAPVPNGQLPVTFDVTGQAWIILKSTPDRQLAAWLFARWFADTERTLTWAALTGQLPLRRSAAEQLRQLNAEDANLMVVLDLLPHAQAHPLVPYWPNVAEAATRAVLSVAAGDAPSVAHEQAISATRPVVVP